MAEVYVFKIWNIYRTKKVSVFLSSSNNMYEQVVLKASEKLQIDGSSLVLESDGTQIDEDESLKYFFKEIFILLQKNGIWVSNQPNIELLSAKSSAASTTSIYDNIANLPVIIAQSLNEQNKNTCSENTALSDEEFLNRSNFNFDSSGRPNPDAFLTDEDINGSSFNLDIDKNNTLVNVNNSTFSNVMVLNEIKPIVQENTWRKFEIPWDKLPQDELLAISENNKCSKQIINNVIRMIVNEMRVLKKDIPYHSFKIISHKMIQKFPGTFTDVDDDGIVLGDGSHTLVSKLHERHNYLNRCYKRKNEEVHNITAPKRKCLASKAGCSSWQPEPTDEPAISIENKIEKLNNSLDSTLEEAELFSLLEDTYCSQRNYINKTDSPSVEDIKHEWPILLQSKVLFWHFRKLTGVDIYDLEKNFRLKCPKIIAFGNKKKLSKFEWKETPQTYMEALKIIAKHFRDDLSSLIIILKEEAELKSIEPVNPCMVILNERYYVVVEKSKLDDGTQDFFNAFKQLYATYYVFNMSYPKKTSTTLEFIQRYFMKQHPDVGTKSAQFSTSKKKVINL